MCGIAGIASTDGKPIPRLASSLAVLDSLVAHRGPDGNGTWISPARTVGLAHRRLAIIDLATELRVRYSFKTPDAIHLATAIEAKADRFLTGDHQLARCKELTVDAL